MEKDYIEKLLLYISKHYEEEAMIKPYFDCNYNIFITTGRSMTVHIKESDGRI